MGGSGGAGRGGSGAGGSSRDDGAGTWPGSGLNTCPKGYVYVVKKRKCMRMKTEDL
jgi:hypothetical protein